MHEPIIHPGDEKKVTREGRNSEALTDTKSMPIKIIPSFYDSIEEFGDKSS